MLLDLGLHLLGAEAETERHTLSVVAVGAVLAAVTVVAVVLDISIAVTKSVSTATFL